MNVMCRLLVVLVFFSEFGDGSTLIKPGRWQRVTITMGGQFGTDRQMRTFVNGQPCATIQKGVFNTPDARFALNAATGALLFGSVKPEAMPGLSVKFVEVYAGTRSAEMVKSLTHANSVFSQWQLDQKRSRDAMAGQLSLSSLYKRPPPMWLDSAFVGEFGDAFVENTGLEGGSIYGGIRVFSLVFSRTIDEQRAWLNGFSERDHKRAEKISEVIEASVEVGRKFMLGRRSPAQLASFLRGLSNNLQTLNQELGCWFLVVGRRIKLATSSCMWLSAKKFVSIRSL
eukprot:GABV01000084.1.p1 GENE.GABV01000084.1~~GABV01000084.1.p1  ORF type:complete len:285 (-),score=73.45 GABV01000084.1:571-1425(-)